MDDPARLPLIVAALDHPQRLRIISSLREGRWYVSALARELGISRPLLYLHLERLEAAGLVTGSLELGSHGRAVKWYELVPFEVRVTPEAVVAAVEAAKNESTATEQKSTGTQRPGKEPPNKKGEAHE